MSRICVKGLPKGCDEAGLRKHFASFAADITDVKLARTRWVKRLLTFSTRSTFAFSVPSGPTNVPRCCVECRARDLATSSDT
jgi:hypothetical protein